MLIVLKMQFMFHYLIKISYLTDIILVNDGEKILYNPYNEQVYQIEYAKNSVWCNIIDINRW